MTIDTIYQGLLRNLTNDNKILSISQKLNTLLTNQERVLYTYEIIENSKAFPTLFVVTKNDGVSTHYRNLGNRKFQQKQDYEAWQYYNLCLLYAPPDSENYSLAIANRSAVLLSLNKYKECSNDIEEVFKHQYPEKLKKKLQKRLCQAMSKAESWGEEITDTDADEIVTLNSPRHKEYICASNKIEVVHTEDMGRHVIAKEDIKVGDVLAQEDPYFILLLKSQYLFSCSYCMSRTANLYPCKNCCYTLYCSEECQLKSWDSYHSVECLLIASLLDLNFTKLELLALRTVIKSRYDHDNWERLFETTKEAEENKDTEHQGMVNVDGNWTYDSKNYTSIHMLSSNVEKRSVSDLFQKSVTAAVMLRFLVKNTKFMQGRPQEASEDILKYVAGNLMHHVMTSPTNMHGISSNIQSATGEFIEEVNFGSAPYAFLSLLNHSCSPNVVRFSKLGSGRMTLFALRPVKKGMQLYDNYGSHHALQSRKERQTALKFQYKFSCLCEACGNDWPLYQQLRPAQKVHKDIVADKEKLLDGAAIRNLQNGDKCTALRLFKPLCELVQVFDRYAPCMELADCQEAMKQCLAILEGVVPYGYSKLVEWNAIPPMAYCNHLMHRPTN